VCPHSVLAGNLHLRPPPDSSPALPCTPPPPVGGIIGFALCYRGASAVKWAEPDPKSFPPYKGVVPIILSWFFSPILTGLAACTIFSIVRVAVLRRKNSFNLAFWVLPIAVFVTTYINVFFVFAKGAAKTLGADYSNTKSAWISAIASGGAMLITAVIIVPLLRRRAMNWQKRQEEEAAAAVAAAKE
jgi:sodium-dependent phosphate transporter